MLRALYSILLYLLTPYLLLRLWWKGRKLPAYRARIAERFCLDNRPYEPIDVWLHAVSLGEVIASIPLIDALLNKNYRILVTTMTPTGAKQIETRFGTRVSHRYLPYDLPWVLKRFFHKIKPKVGLIIETELWPNLISFANKAKIPLLLLNARLSEDSFKGYKRVDFFFKPLLNQFNAIFSQSDADAKRFEALGAQNVEVLGNIKFDLQTKNVDSASFLAVKARFGMDRTVVMVASTHDNEEDQILSRVKNLQKAMDNVIVLIAPRHPERFQAVYELCKAYQFNTGLRSQLDTINSQNEVIVLDSLGELLGFYQIADYAFVGGSLIRIGGHNVLEPIAMGTPVFSGPFVHNFKTICRDLLDAQAIEIAENVDDLIDRIIAMSKNTAKKQQQIDNATQVLQANQGAIARYLQRIEGLIEV